MSLDKFYTKKEVAKNCVESLTKFFPLSFFQVIIEPSAGDGAFLDYLPTNRIALDIEPEREDITKEDWFNYTKKHQEKTLVIGNPPFGLRSSLAKRFIQHAITIGADVVAFILPETFKKLSNQSTKIFPTTFKLIEVFDLPKNSFLKEGQSYHVNCSFFIWVKQELALEFKDLRKKKIPMSEDFVFLNRGDIKADFCINGNNGKIREVSEITNSKAEHYIQAKKYTKEELIKIFSQLEYEWLSSVSGGNAWIGRQEILEAYTKKLNS